MHGVPNLVFGRNSGVIQEEVRFMERFYKKMYFDLFRMLAMAVEAFDEEGGVFKTREILIAAMRAAEEANMEMDIIPEE